MTLTKEGIAILKELIPMPHDLQAELEARLDGKAEDTGAVLEPLAQERRWSCTRTAWTQSMLS